MKKAYVEIDDGQIHYITEGEGEPLLLFHQAPLSSVEWERVIPILSQHFQVIAPDMIGHGNSDDPEHEYEVEDFTRATLRFMDALGIEQAVVGGNHSGAALATSISLTAPERVRKLIVSVEMLVTRQQIEQFLAALEKQPMSRDIPMDDDGEFVKAAWSRYKILGPSSPPETRFRPFIIGQAARERPFDAHYAVLRWMATADHVSNVRCPVLVFGAENDLFFSDELMADAPRRIADCRTRVIADAGALSAFEQPVALGNALLEFLVE